MRPVYQELQLAAPDDNGIALAQQLVGAGNLTLNGVMVTGGVADLGVAQRVGIASAGNLSAVTFTVYGTDYNGDTISESLAGPNNNSVNTVLDYLTVTRIAASAAVGTNVIAGTVGIASFPKVVLDQYLKPFEVTMTLELLSGTGTASAEWTTNPIFDTSPPYTWYPSDAVDVAESTTATLISPVSACRGVITSGTGQWRFGVQQAGVIG